MGGFRKHVWELVHSLTESEVQKFKDRAFQYKRGRYAKYVVLFDALRKQPSFNDKELKEQLKDHSFVQHLHRTKNYLYGKILDYIREAHDGEESQLHALLEKTRILFEKRLYHHLPPLIEKGKRFADSLEDFAAHRRLYQLERMVARYSRGWKDYNAVIDHLVGEEKELEDKENNYRELERLESLFLKIWDVGQQERKEMIREARENPLLNDPNQARSTSARIIQEHVRLLSWFFEGNFTEAISTCDRIIALFEGTPGLMENNAKYTVLGMAIYWAASFRLLLDDTEGAEKAFEKMDVPGNFPRRMPAFFLERKTLFEISFARKTLNFERGAAAIQSFTQKKATYENTLDLTARIQINHLAAELYLVFAQPKAALPFILGNKNERLGSHRPDLLHYSRIFFLMTHYQIENLDIVEREVRSAKTSLGRHKVLNPFYHLILKLFADLAQGKKNPNELFKATIQELSAQESNPLFQQMRNYFDLETWFFSQLEGHSMAEIEAD